MSYLVSQNLIYVSFSLLLGLLLIWYIWNNFRKQAIAQNTNEYVHYEDISQDFQPYRMQADTLEESDLSSSTSQVELLEDKLESLRNQFETLKANRDDLKTKLSIAIEHSKKQAEFIEQTRRKPSETDELKALLGKITERNNLLNIELGKREDEIVALRKTPTVIDDLKSQLKTTLELNRSLHQELESRDKKISSVRKEHVETSELKLQLQQSTERNHALNKELENLQTQLTTRDKEFNNQALLFTNLKKEFESSNAKQKSLQAELETAKSRLIPLENEIKTHKQNLAALQQQSAEMILLRSNLEKRDHEIIELKQTLENQRKKFQSLEAETTNSQTFMRGLQDRLEDANKRVPSLEEDIRIKDNRISSLENELGTLQGQITSLEASIDRRNERITNVEKQLFQAQQQNNPLRDDLRRRDQKINDLEKQLQEAKKVVPIAAIHEPKERETIKSAPKKRKMKPYGLNKPSRKPDDLKLISGVGIVLEKTLNKCGIYYFEQIAGFTRKDVAAVDNMLKFKGRIDRDKWIEQARILMRGGTYTKKQNNKTNKKPATRRTKIKPLGMKRPTGDLDDLQLITGVGPKLERKLHRLGIYHFEQIAGLNRKDIELIDSKLGSYRGRIARDNWPAQARRLHKKFYI